jgi:hypothetical protein
MSRWVPCKGRDFIPRLRELGFEKERIEYLCKRSGVWINEEIIEKVKGLKI